MGVPKVDLQADDGQPIKQWTTVVVGEDELTWLKKALQVNATEDDDIDPAAEELDPLN